MTVFLLVLTFAALGLYWYADRGWRRALQGWRETLDAWAEAEARITAIGREAVRSLEIAERRIRELEATGDEWKRN